MTNIRLTWILSTRVATGNFPTVIKFHEFSRERGWKTPSDPKDTGMMYAFNTDENFFTFTQSQGYAAELNEFMKAKCLSNKKWMEPGFYPIKERLIDGADTTPEAPFLVDIGGSGGHDLEDLRRYYPDTPGKLILEDLPAVIREIKDLDPSIIRMEYNFYDEQPVKGKPFTHSPCFSPIKWKDIHMLIAPL